jgi:hypothetical protein
MTLYEFISLDINEQAEAVWEGKFLGIREDSMHKIFLYKLYDFFCEVYYSKKENKIVRLKPFRTEDLIEKYFSYQLN